MGHPLLKPPYISGLPLLIPLMSRRLRTNLAVSTIFTILSIALLIYNLTLVIYCFYRSCKYKSIKEADDEYNSKIIPEEYPFVEFVELVGDTALLIDHYNHEPDLCVYFRVCTNKQMSKLYRRKVQRKGLYSYFITISGRKITIHPEKDKNFEEAKM